MPEASLPAPRGPRPSWAVGLLVLGVAAVLCGAGAAVTEGTLRRVLLVLLFATAIAVAWLASGRFIERPPSTVVGGAGYTAPRTGFEKVLHSVLSLLYNAGIMIVVFAALLRLKLVLLEFPAIVTAWFPVVVGGYVALLAVAAERRILEQGGVLRTWYTRAHGWVLAGISVPILAAGLILAIVGEVESGGVRYLVEDDLVVLVLVGVMGVGTQLFLAANLPTMFDLATAFLRVVTTRRRVGDTPPFVYAAVIALSATILVAIVAVRFDLLSGIGYFRDERVALLLVLVPVAAAAFFASAATQIWREGRRGLYKKRLPTQLRNDLVVYGLSALVGLTGGVLLVLNFLGHFDGWGPVTGQGLQMDLIALTIVGTAWPIGIYLHRQDKRVDGIEARLPDFLSDLAETRRAGLTMSAALHSCALSDYGPLSPEVKKMSQQVGWGVPFNEALAQFAQRVKTSLVERSTSLIIEASRTGGSVAEILKAAAKDAHEIKGLEQDRRVQMLTYLIVIYVVFGVFLLVIAVMDGQFIPEVLAANKAAAENSGLQSDSFGNQNDIEFASIHFAYFLAAIVQSVGNGMVGGVLSEGQVRAGFRHAALMAGMSWLVFRFLLAP
ncbi:MAG: type II secretion system F family protein [Candidatus Thermoplasmatota archaeon]